MFSYLHTILIAGVLFTSPSQGGSGSGSSPAVAVKVPQASSSSASPLPPPTQDCPANIIWAPYVEPQLMIPIDGAHPAEAYGPTESGQVTPNASSTLFNFDVPTADAGKSCKVFFTFPTPDEMAPPGGGHNDSGKTDYYVFGGSGGVKFARLEGPAATLSTRWNDVFASNGSLAVPAAELGQVTLSPGHTYVVDRFACPAGQTLTYLMTEPDGEDTVLAYNQTDVPLALGLFMSSC